MSETFPELFDVIEYIHKHLDEPLSLEQLARYAAYSPNYFNQKFKNTIGLPPLYYISSLRLQKAKDMLLHTPLSVRDIAMEIGQQSLGTFTTRFTQKVGVSPSAFRHSIDNADQQMHAFRRISKWRTNPGSSEQIPSLTGTVLADEPFQGFVLIGLFAKPIPEGIPLYGTMLPGLGEYYMYNVKPGRYYLMATSVSWTFRATDCLLPYTTLRTRSHDPVVIDPLAPIINKNIMLHPPRLDDPPILISLPLLMSRLLKANSL